MEGEEKHTQSPISLAQKQDVSIIIPSEHSCKDGMQDCFESSARNIQFMCNDNHKYGFCLCCLGTIVGVGMFFTLLKPLYN